MKKILISYGNELYYSSLKRLKFEAESIGIFDEIRIFTDKDLPDKITHHPLFQYKRGGGYWFWKPYIILQTLSHIQEDDVVVYSDAGSQLFKDKEWDKWWNLMKHYNGIFFCYGGTMEQFCRKNLLDYYDGNKWLKYYYQIQGGLCIVNKRSIPVIKEWFEIMYQHPDMIVDVPIEERKNESKHFREHRHDQSALSCAVYKYERKCELKILWQRLESRYKSGQAVYAARMCEGRRRPAPSFEVFYVTIAKSLILYPFRKIKMKILKLLSSRCTWNIMEKES